MMPIYLTHDNNIRMPAFLNSTVKVLWKNEIMTFMTLCRLICLSQMTFVALLCLLHMTFAALWGLSHIRLYDVCRSAYVVIAHGGIKIVHSNNYFEMSSSLAALSGTSQMSAARLAAGPWLRNGDTDHRFVRLPSLNPSPEPSFCLEGKLPILRRICITIFYNLVLFYSLKKTLICI